MQNPKTLTTRKMRKFYYEPQTKINITRYRAAQLLQVKEGDFFAYNTRKWASILHVLSGHLEYKFDNYTLHCRTDDVMFLPQGSSYVVNYIEDSTVIGFDFHTDDTPDMDAFIINGFNLYSSYKKIEEYSVNPTESSYYAILSEIYYVISKILLSDNQKDLILGNAVKIINDNFHDPAFLCQNISETLNISESYLRAKFKKAYGMSPYRYLTAVRMQEALALLSSNVTITETALMVGYSDIFQFSKAFKKFYGYPPSEAKRII